MYIDKDDKEVYRARIYDTYLSNRSDIAEIVSVDLFAPRLPLLKRIIKRHFPADKEITVLDLGCGSGAFLFACQLLGYRNLKGIDRSQEQVSQAQQLGLKGVEYGDLNDVLAATSANSIDVIIAFDVIEHFTKSELVDFTDSVNRALRPDGKWIIHAPNGEGIFGSKVYFSDLTHEQAFTRYSITQLLKASNFKTVVCEEDSPVPHGLKSTVRAILWGVVRLFYRALLAVETGDFSKEVLLTQNLVAVAVKK
jgi:2-polyprenyl-3-methyl-5-hydroxy-6-metoxy-1,4-benzoquinol methylase